MHRSALLVLLLLAGCLQGSPPVEDPLQTVAPAAHCEAELGTVASAFAPLDAPEAAPPIVGTPETPLGSVPPPPDLPLLSDAGLVLRHRHFVKATLVDLAIDPDTGEPWVVTLEGRVLRGAAMQDEVLNRSAQVLPLDKEAGLLSAETFRLDGAPRLAIVEATPDLVLRVVSFPLVGEPGQRRADTTAPRVHLERTQDTGYHFGGDLAWHGGGLYLSLGDGQARDPDGRLLAAGVATPYGKVVRLDPATDTVEVLARGLRNPWRMALDAGCGRLLVTDVGETSWEEVNILPLGAGRVVDFGWEAEEGPGKPPLAAPPPAGNGTDAPTPADNGTAGPALAYSHEHGRCAISGGAFRPRSASILPGVFLFSDWCTGELWAYDPDTASATLLADLPAPVFAVRSTARGETWVLTADWESWAGEVLVLAAATPATA